MASITNSMDQLYSKRRHHESDSEDEELECPSGKARNTNGQLEGLLGLNNIAASKDGKSVLVMAQVFAHLSVEGLEQVAKVCPLFAQLATDEMRAHQLAVVPYVERPLAPASDKDLKKV